MIEDNGKMGDFQSQESMPLKGVKNSETYLCESSVPIPLGSNYGAALQVPEVEHDVSQKLIVKKYK